MAINPTSSHNTSSAPIFQFPLAIPLLLLAILFFSYRAYSIAVPTFFGIADEHGYMMTAKRIATSGAIAQHQPDPYAFIGETMMQSPRDPTTYYLRQPIGYPLLLAAAYWLDGPDAPFFVNPLLALALLVAVYIIGKELGSPLMGALAALILAAHPLILYYTLTTLSHIPDMAAAAWSIAFALLWRREKKLWQAIAAGLLAGLAIEIRYTNLLLALPFFIVLLDQLKQSPSSATARGNVPSSTPTSRQIKIHALAAITATILATIPLLIYQTIAFGSPLRTGYSAGGNATSFSLSWFLAHAPAMAAILLNPGTGLSALLLSLAISIILLAKKNHFTLTLLLAWALPPLLLYTAYYGMPQNNTLLYARFALSSFPPLILLAVIWPASLTKLRPLFTTLTAALAILTIALSISSPFLKTKIDELNGNMLFNYAVSNIVRKNAPPHSVILADVFTQYFLDYTGDFTIYTPDMYNHAHLDPRLADLKRTPHESDPARTQQLADLLANQSDDQLMATLRTHLKNYADKGTPVYLVTLKIREPLWTTLLHAHLTPIDSTLGGNALLYRLDFPPTTNPQP